MRWFISGLALALVAGCAPGMRESAMPTPGPSAVEGAARRAPAEPDDEPLPTDPAVIAKAASVKILNNESLGCATEVLGPVDVHKKMQNTQKALDELKLRGAALGAEAVVGVDFEHGEGGPAPTHLSGMAVRCRDLLKGRNYDVIGQISIKGAMGKEEEAFAELKARATAMKADLILDVKFEHGEGGEGAGTMIKGTAIRFRTQ